MRGDVLQVERESYGPVLIADVGGTTSRFAVSVGERPQDLVTICNDTVASLEDAIADYLGRVPVRPRTAVLAVAGPVEGEEVALTNRRWRFRASEVAARFGFAKIRIINDFEALAWALLGLEPHESRLIGPACEPGKGTRVVLGPGTGLGVAALVPAGGGWAAVASEGGHACLGALSAEEHAVLEQVRRDCGIASAEAVLSGPGLVRLYRTLSGDTATARSEDVLERARAGEADARAAAALFVRLLGRFAGDVALMFKATGGVYLAGGVAVALGPLLDEAAFRAAFEAHPPYESLLARIPTRLLACREPGLLGCAALVEQFVTTGREI